MNWKSIRPGTIASAAVSLGLLLTVVTGFVLGLELALLVFGAGVLVLILSLFWASVRNLGGDTPLSLDEALVMGAPSAAEEQKRAVLRALKDLEFERSVGKISEQDYVEFSTRYRAEARRLITAVDEFAAPAKELAQKLAGERLIAAGLAPETAESKAAGSNGSDRAADAEPDSAAPDSDAPAPTSKACSACGAKNDLDARFCKGCGVSLDGAPPREDQRTKPSEENPP